MCGFPTVETDARSVLKWRHPPVISGGCLRNYTEEASGLSSAMSEHLDEHHRTVRDRSVAAPQARRRAAQLREADRRRARGVRRAAGRRRRWRRSRAAHRSGSARSTATSRTARTLLEAVYVDEVEALCRSAADLAELPPWDALVGWLHRFVGYIATKQALAQELLNYVDRDAALFQSCRAALYAAGEPLLQRAQQAGVVRRDTNLTEVIQMIGGIAKIPSAEPAQIDHILDMALDGLRYRTPSA